MCSIYRISGDWVVKVADFGLSMTGYANTYTKMKKEADTRLPIKWMAPEAFDQDKFSEKSDVVNAATVMIVRIANCNISTPHVCAWSRSYTRLLSQTMDYNSHGFDQKLRSF